MKKTSNIPIKSTINYLQIENNTDSQSECNQINHCSAPRLQYELQTIPINHNETNLHNIEYNTN